MAASCNDKFPDTLKGFGYAFNAEGQLRKIDPDTGKPGSEPYEFNVSEDPEYNQRRYEAVGEVINEEIYERLETEGDLHRLPVPDKGQAEHKTYIYVSADVFRNTEKLLIIIHGSGVVRAGQWSRSLIINDNLSSGTQLPFIKRARELGYAVIVTNTNDNTRQVDGKQIHIEGSRDAMDHGQYVWKHYVREAKARHVGIIAHSYGGVVTVGLAMQFYKEFSKRLFAAAMTDSAHSIRVQKVPTKVSEFLQKVGRNWVAADSPLDTPLSYTKIEIPRVSAGHSKHEMTSYSSIDSVFKFIEAKYQQVAPPKQEL